MKKKQKISTSLFSRATKLAGMATKIAAKEAQYQLKKVINSRLKDTQIQTRIQQAIELKNTLSELKGAAMKVGQLLSLEVSEFLPPEVAEVLQDLQANAKIMDFEIIEGVIKSELKEKVNLIDVIDPIPIASASIGQVHKAKYKGQDIALKVQYPGVKKSIESDIKLLNKILKNLLLAFGKKMDLTNTLNEIEYVLRLETNYLSELENLNFTYEKLKNSDLYTVPRPIRELSTESVLAMQHIQGLKFTDWLNTHPSKKDRQIIANAMLDLFHKEFYEWGLVQTDPNFGNYLIQTKPLKLVLLDFGAALSYPPEFIEKYKNFARLTLNGSKEELIQAAIDFNLLDIRENDIAKDKFFELMRFSSFPFKASEQPFDFSRVDYEKQHRKVIFEFTQNLKHSPPPRKIIFLHRKLGGMFSMLKKLKVKVNLVPYWDKIHTDTLK